MAQGYHDFTAGEVLTAANLEDYCQNQSVMRFASSSAMNTALASVLAEGMTCYLIDSNTIVVYSGSAFSTVGPVHGALLSWSPGLTQGTTPTYTTTKATYNRVGRRVFGEAVLTLTGSATGANDIVVSVPVAHTNTSGQQILGSAKVFDSSAGFYYYGQLVVGSTSTTAKIQIETNGAAATFLGSTSFTAALASGDIVTYVMDYEAGGDA